MTAGGSTTAYTYDAAGELKSAGSTNYSYDPAGNRIAAGSASYTYDDFGNLASATSGATTIAYVKQRDGDPSFCARKTTRRDSSQLANSGSSW